MCAPGQKSQHAAPARAAVSWQPAVAQLKSISSFRSLPPSVFSVRAISDPTAFGAAVGLVSCALGPSRAPPVPPLCSPSPVV